jgi:hypothetical protein
VLLLKPHIWINFSKRLFKNPKLTSVVSLLFAGVVLYFLVQSGINIVQILAVTLFVSLLMISGIAPYAKPFLSWVEKKDLSKLFRDFWLYTLVWLILIFWGVVELLR